MKTSLHHRGRWLMTTLLLAALGPVSILWAQGENGNVNATVQGRENLKTMSTPRNELPQLSKEQQADFGQILTLQKTKSWWVTPFVSARGFWTSNALLSNGGEKGDAVFVETQGFNGGYRITPEWQVSTGYNYQLTRYQENPTLDTDGHNLEFNTSYQLPWNWTIGAGDRGMWLDSPHMGTQVYRENNPYASVVQSWNFLDNKLNWFYGYEYDRKYAHPVTFDRDEHTVFTGVAYSWMSNLFSQLVLRQNWQFYDAPSFPGAATGRQEWVSTVALQTIWEPLSWMDVSAFDSETYDNSINSIRDYKVANLGGEIKFFWKF